MDLLSKLQQIKKLAPEKVLDSVPVIPPKPEKAVDPYFLKTDYVSKSALMAMEKKRQGTYKEIPSSVYYQGSMFDAFFTEPDKFLTEYSVSDVELLQLIRAKKAIEKTGILPPNFSEWHRLAINGTVKELPKGLKLQQAIFRERFCYNGQHTVQAKIKTDFRLGSEIIDLKSTTKQSLAAFKKDILLHGLDIQAAFYSDVARAKSFKLIVCPYFKGHHINKALKGQQEWLDNLAKPAECWIIDMAPYIERGRIKYKRLIAEAVEAKQITHKLLNK